MKDFFRSLELEDILEIVGSELRKIHLGEIVYTEVKEDSDTTKIRYSTGINVFENDDKYNIYVISELLFDMFKNVNCEKIHIDLTLINEFCFVRRGKDARDGSYAFEVSYSISNGNSDER